MMRNLETILENMSLDEKIALLAGRDNWTLNGVASASLGSIMVTDGPHGLRKQTGATDHLGLNESVPATCFPPACLSASSWDESLLEEEGCAIGEEALQEGVAVVLGPGTNIKRSPLCGRNFEYFSEDPYLAGKMAAAWIRGVEKQGVGTSLKHFAANNQERFRLVGNSVVDGRALREIYLRPFEIAVKEGRPATLMCSYNRINNVYSCQNRWLLTDVLRRDWGFEGLVMTDWGAMADRVEAVKAGLDLEMPGPGEKNGEKIRSALEDGSLTMAQLDECVRRVLALIVRGLEAGKRSYSVDAHHALSERIASSSFVLLENSGSLPLRETEGYVLIGSLAEHIRYQGAGSSRINPTRLSTIKDAFSGLPYAPGYDPVTGETNKAMLEEALGLCADAKGAIVVVGLPDSYESEGFDRKDLDLPPGQVALVNALVEAGVEVNVVLLCGSPVVIPFRKSVSSLLLCYLGGDSLGTALRKVVTGEVAPSGRLAETFPLALEDNPSWGNFSNEDRNVLYRESIMVGYRWYDWKGLDVAYPFGYGLSYTSFEYSGLEVGRDEVRFTVRNTGSVASVETAQLYIGLPDSKIIRAVRELKGFRKIRLEAGEAKRVTIPLTREAFRYFNTEKDDWDVEEGEYRIEVAASCRDIRLSGSLFVEGNRAPHREDLFHFDGPLPLIEETGTIDMNSPIYEVLRTPGGKAVMGPVVEAYEKQFSGDDDMSRMMRSMAYELPLRSLWMMPGGGLRVDEVVERIRSINSSK